MPCPSNQSPRVLGATITDLLRLHPFKAAQKFQPRNKAELVAAVAISGSQSQSLRALGSNWSLSETGKAENVVTTDELRLHICQPFSPGAPPLPADRLRNGGSDYLARVCSADPRAAGHSFVHVEAGVKLRDLLADLKACGLALPTLGSGAGQSLAGALATSSHGADIETAPMVEWIHAVHLVGAGGQEWWITPEESIFANEEVLRLQDWCEDARIVANDQAFDAVRVSVGRMGVIYSMILEVTRAYSLLEVNLEHAWDEVRKQLNDSVTGLKAGQASGIFDAPFSDLDTGWLRAEVLRRTEETFPHGKFHYVGGPKKPSEPPPSPTKEKRYREMLKDLGLAALAGDLRGGGSRPLHYANIVVNLARPTQCWIQRRWSFAGALRLIKPEKERDDLEKAAIDNKRHPRGMVGPLRHRLAPALIKFGGDPLKVPRFIEFLNDDIPRIAAKSDTSGEVLFMTLYKLATDPQLAPTLRNDMIDAVSGVIGGSFKDLMRAGLATDILDTHDYELDGVQTVNSAEFFFDASSREYIGFIDKVIALASVHAPVFGIIGIRFMPRATALIAMQRFPRTVSIEVAAGRGKQENVYRKFWDAVQQAANERRAIPHWGQEFQQPDTAIAAHYGDDLVKWRRMLAELSIDAPNTFSTPFSLQHGLEPSEATGVFDADAVDQFLAAFEAAASS
jgi:hypothetical protein